MGKQTRPALVTYMNPEVIGIRAILCLRRSDTGRLSTVVAEALLAGVLHYELLHATNLKSGFRFEDPNFLSDGTSDA